MKKGSGCWIRTVIASGLLWLMVQFFLKFGGQYGWFQDIIGQAHRIISNP